jgi:starch synthase
MTALDVLAVASEAYPLVKTGGLADVTGALPAALAAEGVRVRTLLPGYPAVTAALAGGKTVLKLADLSGGPARVIAAKAGGLDVLVLDAPHLFDRPGNAYAGPDGRDWPDNPIRFGALARVAADIGAGALAAWRPAVVHAHDWQAGLAPAYLHYRGGERPGTVMTVHNLAFPGKAPAGLLGRLGLPGAAFTVDGVEFYGSISLLKAGLQFADRITTVSPTYAAEIGTAEFGMGFEGLLRHRAGVVSGILNGIDTAVWNPATDSRITATYDAATLERRVANKASLQAQLGLAADPAAPLFAVVSRLTWQKGMDQLLPCLRGLRALGAQLALLGTGETEIEVDFLAAAREAPGQVACVIGYDEALAHQIQAGADALVVPSRFEPCGLTQLCALRYGTIPVVARVGGLADTVIDANPAALAAGVATGVQFSPMTSDMLAAALQRTVGLYRDPASWRRLQRNAMACDVSWAAPARAYAELYRGLVAERR